MTKIMISPKANSRKMAKRVNKCFCIKIKRSCENCISKSSSRWELNRCSCVRVAIHKKHLIQRLSIEKKRFFRENYSDSKLIPYPIRLYFVRTNPGLNITKPIVDQNTSSDSD